MVKASKFLVLLGGIVGLLGFFLPFVKADIEGKNLGISAFQVIGGIDIAEEALEDADAPTAEAEAMTADIENMLSDVKTFLYAVYAPALLFTLFGVLGVARRRFGRGLGSLSLLLGLLTLGVWALLFAAAGETDASLGLGAQLLLVTGLGGTVGGLVALVKPDRGAA